MRPKPTWKLLSVGCHWVKGPYTISTVQLGPRYGYALYKDRQLIDEFITWDKAIKLAKELK